MKINIKNWVKAVIVANIMVLLVTVLNVVHVEPAFAIDQPFILDGSNNYTETLPFAPSSQFYSLSVTAIPPANTTVYSSADNQTCPMSITLTQSSPSGQNTTPCPTSHTEVTIIAIPGTTVTGVLTDF
ncbi:MAG: hypothetical protein F6K48_01430 [Okeania sp. SIO3H1]|nr:hypothetical protein [Okeania sp. SIO3H1]